MALILTMTLGLTVGYVCTILCYFLLSFAITPSAPHFVSDTGRLRPGYLVVNCMLWLVCAVTGSYTTATLSAAWFPWLPVTALGVFLVVLTWHHPIETQKQLAGFSSVMMAGSSALGVALGHLLKLK